MAYCLPLTGADMKIAFLIWDYSPSRGGQERYLSRLAGALLDRGNEVHLFATRCEQGAERGIHFHRIAVPKLGPALRALCFLFRGRRMLARERYDIVSGMARFFPLDVYRMGSGLHRVWLRKKADRTVARLIAYARPFTWLALFLERKIFDPRHCRHVIANSILCRDQLVSLYRYPAERVTVVYNGVDHDFFHPGVREAHRADLLTRLDLPLDAPVALFASNNLGRKGLDVAIRALALQEHPRLSLLVAGRGRPAGYLELARRMGVFGRVRFLGIQSDMRPCYGASDFLVLPTRYDPFANVCLEAMACGLPVITTLDNGASEIIDEGENGFVIPDPRDARSFAEKMAACAEPAVRERMSVAARGKSRAYTIGRNAEETLAVYRTIKEERDAHPL